jgi:hypothetical protein
MGGGGAGAGAGGGVALLFEAELSLDDGDDELDVFELEFDVPLEWLQPKRASNANAASPRTTFCFRMFHP